MSCILGYYSSFIFASLLLILGKVTAKKYNVILCRRIANTEFCLCYSCLGVSAYLAHQFLRDNT